jgi:hypothetical protein
MMLIQLLILKNYDDFGKLKTIIEKFMLI